MLLSKALATTQLQQLSWSQGWVSYLLSQAGGGEQSVKDGGVITQELVKLKSNQLSFPLVGCYNAPTKSLALTWQGQHQDPPARTTGSACCSWCSAGRWCSSASRSHLFPACRTASATEEEGVGYLAPAPTPPGCRASLPHWKMAPPQKLSSISAGSFNNMNNINLEYGSPLNKGLGRGGREDPNPSYLPAAESWEYGVLLGVNVGLQ